MKAYLFPLAALFLLVLLSLWGGQGQPLDVGAILFFTGWRAAHPQGTSAIVLFTQLGGGPFLLILAALVAGWLGWRGERRRAIALLVTVIGGRIGIEAVKLLVNRPRPAFDAHPVTVFSQSFPSGHAGNTMLTFLALALFAAPERWRRQAVAAAVALSLAIGWTRPVLGVHWPSDVVAGWLWGLLVVRMAWLWFQKRQSAA